MINLLALKSTPSRLEAVLFVNDTEDVSLNLDKLSSVDDSVDATASAVSLFL